MHKASKLLPCPEVSREVWSALSQHAEQKEQVRDVFTRLQRPETACPTEAASMRPGEPYISKVDADFDVRLDKHGDIVLLTLTGRLEGVACHVLQQYLVKVLATAVPTFLVLDLEGLTTADPHGRDILLAADRHARASGGQAVIIGGGTLPALADTALEVRESLDGALAELRRRRRTAEG